MGICSYNCDDLPSHQQNDCGEVLFGGIDAVAILECDHTISDFSNDTQWQDNIDSGKVRMVKGIKATFPEASPIQGENTVGCGPENILDGFTQPFSFKDFNVNSVNDDFYQKLNLRKTYMAFRMCESQQIRVAEFPTAWVGKPALVPESNTEKQHYIVAGEFKMDARDAFPTLHNEPTGIFD